MVVVFRNRNALRLPIVLQTQPVWKDNVDPCRAVPLTGTAQLVSSALLNNVWTPLNVVQTQIAEWMLAALKTNVSPLLSAVKIDHVMQDFDVLRVVATG